MFKPLSENKRSDWKKKIEKQKNSGLSASRWCQKHNIPYRTFFFWKKRLSLESSVTRSSFLELSDSSMTTGVSLEYQGIRVILEKSFDPKILQSCLTALRGL